ncbi:uncharacterized protein BBA_03967 [Beauveria bassiana ARSEF 2860]|uniref:Secreted protein n=1 Tax=Beauveria bassiana (strain ARSEF 2860) TaxID=655819 RepID=J5JQV3_BEAB2|nr:uncharacterized protein BBA_03967 [Beauveria bassiana ARSEF 2860]EJP67393.1 hypothetical protein BBA_03967 [Beauveria bassiana ARSEF 2860]
MHFLTSLLALAPAATLVYGAETSTTAWNVQRMKQNCGNGGCNQEFYINGELRNSGDPYANPFARQFDSHCSGLGLGFGWEACRSYIPYTPEGEGGFARIDWGGQDGKEVVVSFTWLNSYGAKKLNETGSMVVEPPGRWDVAKCRQMTMISKVEV